MGRAAVRSQRLHTYEKRKLALGLGQNEDLTALLAGLSYEDDGKAIDEIIDRALDRAGTAVKADYGTAVHKLAEPGNEDAPIPERMQADVQAVRDYLTAMDAEYVLHETFVVCDELKLAGTFDALLTVPLWRLPLTPGAPAATRSERIAVIADIKTGAFKPGEHAIQLAIYSRGQRYDPATGQRTPLAGSGGEAVHPQWGLVVHAPRGQGTATGYWIDLAAGWSAAKLASQVQDWRDRSHPKRGDLAQVASPDPMPAELHRAIHGEAVGTDVIAKYIGQAKTIEALHGLWARTQDQWTDDHIELAKARKALLAGGVK